MGSPTIFSGKYTKLLTSGGVLKSDGATLENDGLKNYITYNNFEIGATTGWSLGITGTLTNAIPTGTPTFGSGASGNLSLSAVNSGAIRGTRSLSYASSATTTVGNMVASAPLSIDPADRAKVLTFKFYYSVPTNPSNGNFSGTSANSFGVAVYDVTNSAWLGVAGNFSMTQNSGVGIASGTFQTNSNTASLRFCVYNANASAGAITVYFDDFYLGPQTAPIGPVVTDWVSYTPTGSWANTTYAGIWRRVGDTMQGRVRLACTGVPTNTTLTVSLPSGYSIDLAKYPSSQPATVGFAYVEDFGVTGFDAFTFVFNSTSIAIKAQDVNASYERGATITGNTIPFAWNNQDYIVLDFSVIIAGWSSSVQMSNDTDTRVVSLSAGRAQAAVTGGANITGFTTFQDTHGAFNSSTGIYTIPVTGDYVVAVSGALPTIGSCSISTIYDGSGVVFTSTGTAGATRGVSSALLTGLPAGKTISFRSDTSVTLTAELRISIYRLSGPSVVAASETVACRYYIANNSAPTHAASLGIPFDTKDFDTHGMASGLGTTSFRLTAPVSGTYLASISAIIPGKNGTSQTQQMTAFKNGVTAIFQGSGNPYTAYTSADGYTCAGSGLVKLNAGEYIIVTMYYFRSDGTTSNYVSSGNSQISFVRVGN
jgi:hypothetical protein